MKCQHYHHTKNILRQVRNEYEIMMKAALRAINILTIKVMCIKNLNFGTELITGIRWTKPL